MQDIVSSSIYQRRTGQDLTAPERLPHLPYNTNIYEWGYKETNIGKQEYTYALNLHSDNWYKYLDI